jgi:ergothioneine biosynthesis protein EgtB
MQAEALSNAWAADRAALLARFRRARARTAAIFAMVPPQARLSRPIPLRHPVVFYEGHIPVFSVNTIVGKGLGRPGIDAGMERLFARGIDPEDEAAAAARAIDVWPARERLAHYVGEADRVVEAALASDDLARSASPAMRRGEAVFTAIEHELMHQETLLYILHRLPRGSLAAPGPFASGLPGTGTERDAGRAVRVPSASRAVRVPAGLARLGTDRRAWPFGWDNEFEPHEVEVGAFAVGADNVTNEDFLAFLEAGGYESSRWWSAGGWEWRSREGVSHPPFWERRDGRWHWRGLFEDVPLPPAWPVYVTQAEASAYARWKGGRLLTEAEYDRAAFATPEGRRRRFPWGDEPPDPSRGNFDFTRADPAPAGSWPAGDSAWGIHDLAGNGWEWTSTVFGPFPGFEPMPSYPEYSADFFDGRHFVMKGASPATARELLRPGFRNWFRPHYPYVYATFRVAWDE